MALPTPTLHTARLRLRPFDDADKDALFALHSSPHVLRYWDSPPWSERGRAERFIAACRQLASDGSGARLAVDRASDDAFLGWCSLTRWNPDYRSAAMGYCFDEAAWGHGYATEAARAVLQWAFDTLDLNRVQAETDTRNAASARVLEKLGFRREGTLRQDCIVNGDVSDSWVYGLLRPDWQRRCLRARSETQREHVPLNDGGELDTALAFLNFQRACVFKKIEGLDDEQLRRRLVVSDTTLLGLVKHSADGERWWFAHHLGGDPAYADIDWTMVVPDGVPAVDVVADYRAAIAEADRYIAAAGSPDTRTALPVGDDGPKTLRWVLAHTTAEIARHLGHMDILREQIDEVTGR